MRTIRIWLATKVARWIMRDAAGGRHEDMNDHEFRDLLHRIRWSYEYLHFDIPANVANLHGRSRLSLDLLRGRPAPAVKVVKGNDTEAP